MSGRSHQRTPIHKYGHTVTPCAELRYSQSIDIIKIRAVAISRRGYQRDRCEADRTSDL